jgi:hypothetical protein
MGSLLFMNIDVTPLGQAVVTERGYVADVCHSNVLLQRCSNK